MVLNCFGNFGIPRILPNLFFMLLEDFFEHIHAEVLNTHILNIGMFKLESSLLEKPDKWHHLCPENFEFIYPLLICSPSLLLLWTHLSLILIISTYNINCKDIMELFAFNFKDINQSPFLTYFCFIISFLLPLLSHSCYILSPITLYWCSKLTTEKSVFSNFIFICIIIWKISSIDFSMNLLKSLSYTKEKAQ